MKELAECVGLWLAEGDNKTKYEVTFTNNCIELILFFQKIIKSAYNGTNKPRLYIYSPTKRKVIYNFKGFKKINYYIDKRANKPYYIYRLADVKFVKIWKKLVSQIKQKPKHQEDILRGFFAGEGNIKYTYHNSKSIRIFQNKKKEFIDNILKFYNINYKYLEKEKYYNIHGRYNWDKLAKIKIANLHPIKKQRFWAVYNSFKEYHYQNNYLKKNILKLLNKPHTTKELSRVLNRSQARIAEVLVNLKKQKKIRYYQVGSRSYWTKDRKILIISKLKCKYLQLFNRPRTTTEFAKIFKVCYKSSFKRLKELEKLSLVKRKNDKKWVKIPIQKSVVVY